MGPPLLIVLGGIGSGKSRLATMFAERGAAVADADRLGHVALTEPAIVHRVARRWPTVVADGHIDRTRLAEIVFATPVDLRELESIVHPRIREMINEYLSQTAGPLAIEVSVPHAAPPGGLRLVVDASEDTRRQRLRARGMSEEQIASRMQLQPSRAGLLELADVVVNNDRDEASLAEAATLLWNWWLGGPQAPAEHADNGMW